MEPLALLSIYKAAGGYFASLSELSPPFGSPAGVVMPPGAPGGWVELDQADTKRLQEAIDAAGALLRLTSSAAHGPPDPQYDNSSDALERLGKLMFALLPLAVQHRLIELPDDTHLLLITNDSRVPWELLHDGVTYLSLRRPTARQLLVPSWSNCGVVPNVTRPRFLFISDPEGDLAEASIEARELAEDFDSAGSDVQAVFRGRSQASKLKIQELLASGQFDLIHWSGHVQPGSLDVADGQITGDEIRGVLKGHPFVFLNGCSSTREKDRTGAWLNILNTTDVQAPGLVEAFLQGGAVGFIGTIWPISDAAARHFARWFYSEIRAGLPVGEALRRTRQRAFSERPADAIWASYMLIGDPRLRLARPAPTRLVPVTILVVRFQGLSRFVSTANAEEAGEIQGQFAFLLERLAVRHKARAKGPVADWAELQFGLPETHEDDAHRALTAALDLTGEFDRLLKGFDRDAATQLTIHIGIHSGTTLERRNSVPSESEPDVSGNVSAVAAGLAEAALSSQILITQKTHRLTQADFVAELIIPDGASADFPPGTCRLVGRKERMAVSIKPIGRDYELRQLAGWWQDACNGQGCVVDIVGQAGIGKTLLLQTLAEQVLAEGARWVGVSCLADKQTASYFLLGQLWRQLAQITPEDDVPTGIRKLTLLLGRGLPAGVSPDEALAILRPVLGLEAREAGQTRLESEIERPAGHRLKLRTTKLAGILRAILAHESSQQPFVVAFDDLQWADEDSMAVMDQLIGQVDQMRVIILAAHRPEWSRQWGHWGHYRHLAVNELSAIARKSLVSALLDADALPEAVHQAVTGRAGGNPLFIREVLRSLQEGGDLKKVAAVWEVAPGESGDVLPMRIEGLILSRLARLPELSRRILETAAVLGPEFEYIILHHVLSDAEREFLEDTLADLARRDAIMIRGWHPSTVYTFRHDLIQVAAYQSLREHFRCAIHRLAADALYREYGATDRTSVERIGQHHYLGDSRPDAIRYCLLAGQYAAESWAFDTALRWYERAKEKLDSLLTIPPTDMEIERGCVEAQILPWRIEALTALADAQSVRGANDRAIANYQEALELGRTSGLSNPTQQADLCRRLAVAYHEKGEMEPAEEWLKHGLEVLDQPESPEAGRLYVWLGNSAYRRGRLKEGLAACSHAIQVLEKVDSVRELAQAHNLQGVIYRTMGDLDEAERAHQQSISLYESLGYTPGLERAYSNLGCVHQDSDRWDEALRCFGQSKALSVQTGEWWRQAAAAINIGEIVRRQGELAQAIECNDEARTIAGQYNFRLAGAVAAMNLGAAHLDMGDLVQARGLLEEARDSFRQTGNELYLSEVTRYLAELHLRRSEKEEALQLAEEALRYTLGEERSLEQARARRTLGRVLVHLGQLAAAEAELEHSLHILQAQRSRYEVALTWIDLALLRKAQGKLGEGIPDRQSALTYCDLASEVLGRLGAQRDLQRSQEIRRTLL